MSSSRSGFSWTCLARDGSARAGLLATAHGQVATPAFMPVATAATVKGITAGQVREAGAGIVLANTYHLMLRPGAGTIARLGGLHRFMDWPGPILTDSGGFQLLSLKGLARVDEEGATFRSHIDGSRHRLTPEDAVAIQHDLDSTVAMVLDECTEHPASRARAGASMERSMRWAVRSKAAFRPRQGYGLFGIVQGGVFDDLRRASAEALAAIGFDGYGLGGLAVGEGQAEMFRVLDATLPALPRERARYLMGVGRPDDLVGAVARGIDMFDCVLPTRSGRHGHAFTRSGRVNLRNARWRDHAGPLDEGCRCPACRRYGLAYLHHLFRCGELLGPVLATLHNLAFYQWLMAAMREAIVAGRFHAWQADFLAAYRAGERARS